MMRTMNRTSKTWRILWAFSLLCLVGCAENEEAEIELRQKRIQSEVSTLAADHWAGKYYYGDGLGVNVQLDIAPEAGFAFEWHGCLGVYDQNYGTVREQEGEIHLTFELENTREGFQGIAPAFLPVRWGERRYLIATDEVVKFCNAINYGTEPRSGSYGLFLLHQDDWKKEVPGIPVLPEKYRSYLLSQKIDAMIREISKTSLRKSIADWIFRDTVVVLDVGKKHGVQLGMEFHVYEPTDAFESGKVTNVSEDSCEVTVIQIGEEEPLPKIGWKLSTGPRPEGEPEVDDKAK